MSTITITLNIIPFDVPAHVTVENAAERPLPGQAVPRGTERHMKLPMKYPLGTLDEATLMLLCDEFTDAVFKKAGKVRPPR